MIWPTLILAFLLQAFSQTEPPPGGAIRGIVVRAGTSEPVAGATVFLLTAVPRAAPPLTTTTDSGGRFAFTEVAENAYRLGIAANGYVRMEYGQRAFPGNGTLLNLAAGQTIENLVAPLTPTGSVSGRIRGADGQPLAGVPVQLVGYTYNSNGERSLRFASVPQMGGPPTTDDRGEYRLYHITPGRYYLSAGTPTGSGGYSQALVNSNVMRESFTQVYYPGVSNPGLATVIEVRPGQDQGGIDFTLRPQPFYRVRGRIVDAATGAAPANPAIDLAYYDPASIGGRSRIGSSAADRPAYQDGTFEFRGVVPGSFIAHATADGSSGFVPVEVVNADVDNVLLTISEGASITGRWRIEGVDAPPGTTAVLELRASAEGLLRSVAFVSASLRADGTFSIDNVPPGEYRVTVLAGVSFLRIADSLIAGSYLKEARTSRADVLRQPLRIEGAGAETLDILISPRAATVEGTVRNANLEPVGGARVVVVPDRERNRTEAFHAAMTDQNGRFSIGSIAPGDYRVFAWEAIETFGWFDPETLRRGEPNSRAVRLSELSRESVDLQVIPQ